MYAAFSAENGVGCNRVYRGPGRTPDYPGPLARIRSPPVLVNLATRADVRNDNNKTFHAKKDSKIADSSRSLIVPALQRLRALRVKRIGLQFIELVLQPAVSRRVAPREVPCGLPG